MATLKYEIRNQGANENYISGIEILLDEFIFNGTAETKLAMLAFLYCREFVKKNSIGFIRSEITDIFILVRIVMFLQGAKWTTE